MVRVRPDPDPNWYCWVDVIPVFRVRIGFSWNLDLDPCPFRTKIEQNDFEKLLNFPSLLVSLFISWLWIIQNKLI
jgi:hypothetical protein